LLANLESRVAELQKTNEALEVNNFITTEINRLYFYPAINFNE